MRAVHYFNANWPQFYPPRAKPPKQTRINRKPFPTEHTTQHQIYEVRLYEKKVTCVLTNKQICPHKCLSQ